MTHPVINVEEKIGKTVGRRKLTDAFRYAMGLQKTVGELRKSLGVPGIPRGVYRFNSHEEADQWLMKQMMRRS
jgi:hypothetical protein